MPLFAISPIFYGAIAIAFLVLAPFVFRSYSVKSFGLTLLGIGLVALVVWQWSNLAHLASFFSATSETAHAQPVAASHTVVKQTVQEHAVSVSRAHEVAQAVKPKPQPQAEHGIPFQVQLGVITVILVISGYLFLLTRFGRRRVQQEKVARGRIVCGQCSKAAKKLYEYRYQFGDGILQRRLCPTCAQECHAQLVHE